MSRVGFWTASLLPVWPLIVVAHVRDFARRLDNTVTGFYGDFAGNSEGRLGFGVAVVHARSALQPWVGKRADYRAKLR